MTRRRGRRFAAPLAAQEARHADADDPHEVEAAAVAERITSGSDGSPLVGVGPARPVLRREAHGSASTPRPGDPTPAGVGEPLPLATRAWAEPRFGAGFDDVRVHTGGAAGRAADQLSARAFTVGQHITFATGQYAPESAAGRRLLAHELTHVVQGGQGQVRRQPVDAGAGAPAAPAGTALEQVRAAMGEVSPVAGVGNFPKAFEVLATLDLGQQLVLMDALYPKGELDVLMASTGSAKPDQVPRLQTCASAVRQAHTAAQPLTGITGLESLSADEQTVVSDFVASVQRAHEAAALAQAATLRSTGTSRLDILQQAGLLVRMLTALGPQTSRFGGTVQTSFVLTVATRRADRLRQASDPAEVLRWGPQVAAQLDIVKRVTTALAFVTNILDGGGKGKAGETVVPDYQQPPLGRVARAYVSALEVSDLAGVGYERLAYADRLSRLLQVELVQATFDHAKKLLVEAKAMTTGNVDWAGALLDDVLTKDLAQARELAERDPVKSAELVKHVEEHLRDIHTTAVVINSEAHLSAVHASLQEYIKKCYGQDFFVHAEALTKMRDELAPYRTTWSELKIAYLLRDRTGQDSWWQRVRAESAGLAALLTRIDQRLQRVARELAILDFAFRIAILAVIGVLTGGLGVYLTGVAATLELGAAGTFLLVTGGEALFFTAASTLAFEKDPTVGKFISQLAVNWATFGAMRGVSALYRGVLGPAAKTLPGAAGEVMVMLTAQTITSLAIADAQKMAATGKGLTADEAQHIAVEGLVVGIATMVGMRTVGELMPGVKASGGRLGTRLLAVNRARAALWQRAQLLAGRPIGVPAAGGTTGGPAAATTTPPAAKPPGTAPAKGLKPPSEAREEAQRLLDDDAAQLKQEGEVLRELNTQLSKDPASADAQAVKAALTANEAAVTKAEVAKIASIIEPVTPTEAMCEQGRLAEVAEFHRKNPDVTVTEGVDADGAKTLLVSPKDPAAGPPLRITERLTPGAQPLVTAPPEPSGKPVTAPAESPYKSVADLLREDGQGFKDKTLDDAYQRYRTKKQRAKEPVKDPASWAQSQTSGDYRARLESELGADFFKRGRAKIRLQDKARPRSYGAERYLADEAAVRPWVREMLKAAGVDPEVGIPNGEISQGAFNGAKGVVAEVLARRPVADLLLQLRKTHPGAVILRGLRMRVMRGGKLSAPKLFTDAVIGVWDGKNLRLLARVEVKSGSTGGQEATVQFFEWVEGRLAAGSELVVPGRTEPVVYGPNAEQRAAGYGTVSGLANAQTVIVAPKGSEHLGLGSEMQTVTEHGRAALDVTAPEIEFLTRILLEPYVRPAGAPTATSPPVTPAPVAPAP